MEEKIKNDNIEAILEVCKRKYEEEINRENIINTKALFLITVLSILISILYNVIEYIYSDYTIDKVFLFALLFTMIILLLSLSLAVFSQCMKIMKGLPFANDFKEALEQNGLSDINSAKNSMILMYDEIILDKYKKNNKIAKLLQKSFVLLLIAIMILVLISLHIIIKEVII